MGRAGCWVLQAAAVPSFCLTTPRCLGSRGRALVERARRDAALLRVGDGGGMGGTCCGM